MKAYSARDRERNAPEKKKLRTMRKRVRKMKSQRESNIGQGRLAQKAKERK